MCVLLIILLIILHAALRALIILGLLRCFRVKTGDGNMGYSTGLYKIAEETYKRDRLDRIKRARSSRLMREEYEALKEEFPVGLKFEFQGVEYMIEDFPSLSDYANSSRYGLSPYPQVLYTPKDNSYQITHIPFKRLRLMIQAD